MKNKKKISSIFWIIIIVFIFIIEAMTVNYSEVKKYIRFFLPVGIIFLLEIIVLLYLKPTEVLMTLIKVTIVVFFIMSFFYLLQKGLDEKNSFFISTIIFSIIFLSTFIFKKRVKINTQKNYLKNNWYEVDFPFHVFADGSMILRRNINYIDYDFMEVIFVNKDYEKIICPYDHVDKDDYNNIRRVKKNKKVGFIENGTKEIIIPIRYDFASRFWGEEKPVSSVRVNKKTFLISTTGKIIPHED